MFRRKPTRRGVILLVVLSLIVLFTLIAVTYAIVASQYKMTARAAAKLEVVGDDPRNDLDRTAYIVVRDSNVESSLTSHSLLRDKLGADGVRGRVTSATSILNGQFIQLSIAAVNGTFADQPGHYNGCEFTFVTGAQRGYTTRVMGYDPTNAAMQIATQDNDAAAVNLPAVGDEFVINGRMFNGTGFGYVAPVTSSDVPALNQVTRINNLPSGGNAYTDAPVALLPHFAGYGSATLDSKVTDVGGADESYDAPDHQNMHIAMVPASAVGSNDILPSYHRSDLIAYWIKWLNTNVMTMLSPAEARLVFERPYGNDWIPNTADESVAPWQSVPLATRVAIVDLKRRIIFRPLPEDHPNFNGGNPMFTVLGGTVLGALDADGDNRVDRWDVDNDGDGIADSIWIDPGFPITTAKDGRQYKKLMAILIRDMDGRVNLNAMGAIAHTGASFKNLQFADSTYAPQLLSNANLPRGLGVGPADIYLGDIFGTSGLSNITTGRYGVDTRPGSLNTDDLLSALKRMGTPNNYTTAPEGFGSPPDMSGRGQVALDHNGQPMFASMGNANETTDDPYDSDPLANRGEDAMYTPAEFERILRYNDPDASLLPNRLYNIDTSVFSNESNRKIVTTHSADIPVSNTHLPFDLRTSTNTAVHNLLIALQNNSGRGPSLLDIYRARYYQGGLNYGSNGVNEDGDMNTDEADELTRERAKIALEMRKVAPFEILHGQKFDINRWWGNGVDDDGNGVIDEPFESHRFGSDGVSNDGDMSVDEADEQAAEERVWPSPPHTQFANVRFSNYNDNPIKTLDDTARRQMYARNLFCLMMLVMDNSYEDPFPAQPGLTQPQRREYTIRRIAQWAINAVDFRDPDAIMTPFEYDVNPWNGWYVDGNIATDESTMNFATNMQDDDGDGQTDEADEQFLGRERRVVWGAEYPDLVINENVAFHNRGVRDTDLDGNGMSATPSKAIVSAMRRDDMDQFRIPQGSWYLELYCPRNTSGNNSAYPAELYNSTNGLDLGRMAPARQFSMGGPQLRHPVWRAVVTAAPPGGQGMQGVAANAPVTTTFEPNDLGLTPERIVWFSPQDPGAVPEANMIFWERTGTLGAANNNQPAVSNVVLAPCRYAVVGPRSSTVPSAKYLGMDGMADTYEAGTEQIRIGSATFDTVGYAAYPTTGTQIQSPLGIICAADPPASWVNNKNSMTARKVGMNISEPLPTSGNYYPEPNPNNDMRVPKDAYVDPALPFNPTTNYCPDTPFDTGGGGQETARRALLGGSLRTRTIFHHKAVFLQRLANPLLPWNPDPTDPQYGSYYTNSLAVNPYITVDWSSIDLTVYNGEDYNTQEPVGMMGMEWRDQDDPDPYALPVDERFSTRERGVRSMAVDRNFWPPMTTTPRTADALNDRCFPYQLKHTLGFVNWTVDDLPNPMGMPAAYVGSPNTLNENPYPWLAWNNRPYANPLELMMVPASSPQRLCYDFGVAQGGHRIYDASQGPPLDPARDPYSYLLNFFLTSPGNTVGEAPHYYRLLDHIETPSPYAGTEKWFYPANFADTSPNDQIDTSAHQQATFRPPFNRLPRYRDPGKMNINTFFDFREWRAVASGFPAYESLAFYDKLVTSRRGYAVGSYGDYPTIFSNPFRSANSADIAVNLATFGDYRKTGAEVGLLRPDTNSSNINTATVPLFAIPSGNRYDNTARNPYFAYRGINRLSNLTSNHSNVYAMWITMGYFYVEPAGSVSPAHPDGMRLTQEVGSDQGTVQRHRSFYLIDRSVPVAFEPGENHNVDRVFMIRRFIE